MLGRSRIIKILATGGWLTGLTVSVAGCVSHSASTTPKPIPAVPLESIKPEEMVNYAKAVMAIEQRRQATYKDIQQINDAEKVPNVICTQPDTITDLSRNLQSPAVNYCNQAKNDIESIGMTIERFNGITVTAQTNDELETKIKNELIRLQR